METKSDETKKEIVNGEKYYYQSVIPATITTSKNKGKLETNRFSWNISTRDVVVGCNQSRRSDAGLSTRRNERGHKGFKEL
jgi:hypothetical protein